MQLRRVWTERSLTRGSEATSRNGGKSLATHWALGCTDIAASTCLLASMPCHVALPFSWPTALDSPQGISICLADQYLPLAIYARDVCIASMVETFQILVIFVELVL